MSARSPDLKKIFQKYMREILMGKLGVCQGRRSGSTKNVFFLTLGCPSISQ